LYTLHQLEDDLIFVGQQNVRIESLKNVNAITQKNLARRKAVETVIACLFCDSTYIPSFSGIEA